MYNNCLRISVCVRPTNGDEVWFETVSRVLNAIPVWRIDANKCLDLQSQMKLTGPICDTGDFNGFPDRYRCEARMYNRAQFLAPGKSNLQKK